MLYTLQYTWAVIYVFGVFIFAGIFAIIPLLLSKGAVRFEKTTPYECGVEPFGFFSQFFNVQFFIVGVLFLIFDLELLFLLPWAATAFKFAPIYGVIYFFPFYVFVVFLIIGYIFEWSVGVLNWTFGNLKN